MDRNHLFASSGVDFAVALRKESVDRNPPMCTIRQMLLTSLSARRAWIEIIDYIIDYVNDAMSLSARRAWIEIFPKVGSIMRAVVALRKESVDRNLCAGEANREYGRSLSARRAWIEITFLRQIPR